MSSNTAKKKDKQLGMSYGKARARLWLQLIFKMVQKTNQDICYRCNEKIEKPEDFSMDHKQAWLDVSPALFWDLENISYSHRSCNSRAARRNPAAVRETSKKNWEDRSLAPEGMAWCSGHKDFLDKNLFTKHKSRFSGLQKYCKECRSNGVGRGKKLSSM